jgi:hypothetical protein
VDPSIEDLDVQGTISEMEEPCAGNITVKKGDVRFSHDSFYYAPEVRFGMPYCVSLDQVDGLGRNRFHGV